jgi:hypothetical protein
MTYARAGTVQPGVPRMKSVAAGEISRGLRLWPQPEGRLRQADFASDSLWPSRTLFAIGQSRDEGGIDGVGQSARFAVA